MGTSPVGSKDNVMPKNETSHEGALKSIVLWSGGVTLAHISILNSISESSDHRNHQYSCGCESYEDASEVSTQWVRNRISPFSSLSTPLSGSISKGFASPRTAA